MGAAMTHDELLIQMAELKKRFEKYIEVCNYCGDYNAQSHTFCKGKQ